jgi:MinD superfamily P-loop ATPase
VKQLVVVSGKGGTGKTSLCAVFATLAGREVAMGDCDVDASNLAILMDGEDESEEPFFAGTKARIDAELCTGCGQCETVCRFDAVRVEDGLARVTDLKCEGCKACTLVCAPEAISLEENRAGTLLRRRTGYGPLIHARLGVAQDNSGKLVARVREVARQVAEERGLGLAIFDGPPGIGCPVHAAVGGADLLVIVTEPSVSGIHDLERILQLARHFEIPAAVVINKAGLHPPSEEMVESVARETGVEVLGRVPFDAQVPAALAEGKTPLDVPGVAESLRGAWKRIASLLDQ